MTQRWNKFADWELQALDELIRTFGPMRSANPDIGRSGAEIAAVMARRKITRFVVSDRLDARSTEVKP